MSGPERKLGGQSIVEAAIDLFDQREYLLPEFTPAFHSSRERELREQIVDIVRRSCQRHLMISTEGVVSARLDDDSFLITPTGYDRPAIDHESIVLVENSQREAGKIPSRAVRLHQAIYQQRPEIHCIITAQAPYVTAYSIAEKALATRTIPESYIMLLDVPKIPFGKQYTDPEAVAQIISSQCPVVLLQNDCVMTTGSSILQTFDRLEVSEFTARSLIETASIGELVPIGEDEIVALKTRFLS